MSIDHKGIPYFPIYATFFEEEVIELLEAQYGIRASYIVMRLLCKIYKEGYYISWGQEQSIIFIRKIGGEIQEKTMDKIIQILIEKEFFDKESYEKYGILTSEQIQRVWLEATVRRKRDFSKLPYLLSNSNSKNCKQKEEMNNENANNSSVQVGLISENADNSGQTKLNKTKTPIEEEESNNISVEIPGYAYNQATHNLSGLLESMDHYKITARKEKETILMLSDYGKKGTQVWKIFANTNWSKIGAPGKYIISILGGKH